MNSAHVPEEFAENTKDLTKRAVALVELAADSWIVTGRKPVPIIMAAMYLAWQSLKPTKTRLKFSLEKFCQMAKVKKHKPAVRRISEMKEVLCKLGREIPWVREAVTPDNVMRQVEDILQNRHALMRMAMRTHNEALAEQEAEALAQQEAEALAEQEASCKDPAPASPQSQTSDLAETSAQTDLSTVTKPQEEPNWGKRALFAPPCVVHAKRRRVEQPELKEVTGDEEISDSEIDSYIRTPREARDFARTQSILSNSEGEKS